MSGTWRKGRERWNATLLGQQLLSCISDKFPGETATAALQTAFGQQGFSSSAMRENHRGRRYLGREMGQTPLELKLPNLCIAKWTNPALSLAQFSGYVNMPAVVPQTVTDKCKRWGCPARHLTGLFQRDCIISLLTNRRREGAVSAKETQQSVLDQLLGQKNDKKGYYFKNR